LILTQSTLQKVLKTQSGPSTSPPANLQTQPSLPTPGTKPLGSTEAQFAVLRLGKILPSRRRKKLEHLQSSSSARPSFWPEIAVVKTGPPLGDHRRDSRINTWINQISQPSFNSNELQASSPSPSPPQPAGKGRTDCRSSIWGQQRLWRELAPELIDFIFLLGSLTEKHHRSRLALRPNAKADELPALLTEISGSKSTACSCSRHRSSATTKTKTRTGKIRPRRSSLLLPNATQGLHLHLILPPAPPLSQLRPATPTGAALVWPGNARGARSYCR